MILLNFFLLASLFSFLLSILVLLYLNFLRKNFFNYTLLRIKQGEILKGEEIKGLQTYIKDYFSGIKLWLSYRILEETGGDKYKERAISDLENQEDFLKSAATNYLKNFKDKETFEKLQSNLKKDEILLEFHTINSLVDISIREFNLFRENFEKKPVLLLKMAMELLPHLDEEKKKELFLSIKKHFYQKEEIMGKILPFLESFEDSSLYEEILYQLDIFPLSFQEGFIKMFLKRGGIQKYLNFFDFKFKTAPENQKYIYIHFFAEHYSEKNFREALEFFYTLREKEREVFLKDYFPEPEQFVQFIISLKGEISINCMDIIIEKLTLLKHPKTLEAMENLINISKNKDSSLFKFFNLISQWKEEEMKGLLLWILTKIENPFYREKINNFLREKRFAF